MSRDWHCFDIHRPSGYVSNFCFPGAEPCEEKRAEAVDGRYGTVSACTTQRTAACFQLAVPAGLARQLWCSRTLEGCRVRRTDVKASLRPSSRMSGCKLILNIDDYQHHTDFGLPADSP
jgi:hypothetical protein